nr:hypothetical protein [uncultured Lichenicoccus sp.]
MPRLVSRLLLDTEDAAAISHRNHRAVLERQPGDDRPGDGLIVVWPEMLADPGDATKLAGDVVGEPERAAARFEIQSERMRARCVERAPGAVEPDALDRIARE